MQQPYYTIEASVVACNFEILVNDIPILSMEVETQISPNLPINFAIYENGIQNITVIMLPLKGQKTLNSQAELKYNVRLFDVSNDEFNFIKDFDTREFPKIEKNKEVAYLKDSSKFNAEVPYKLTKWDNALNLRDVNDVENKLKKVYKDLANIIEKRQFEEFENRISVRERNMASSMYLTSIEVKSRINSLINDANNGFKVMPLPKDILFKTYGYGKLATYKKINGEPALYLYNQTTNEELMLELMFYIPEGKTEFEII